MDETASKKKLVQAIVVFDTEIFIAEGDEEQLKDFEDSINHYMRG